MARMQGFAMPSGNRSLLIIAALAGLAAAVLFVVAVNNGDSKTSTGSPVGKDANTVVATKTIPSGAVIQADMVVATKIDDKLLIPDAFSDPAKVVGQMRAKYEISANDQISPSKVGAVATGGQFSSVPEHGSRAVSLKVTQNTAVGGLLTAGDRVDIIGTFKIKDRTLPDGQYILRTKTLLQTVRSGPGFCVLNVEVLSVGQEHQEPLGATDSSSGNSSSGTSGAVPENVKENPSASTVTLSLTPEQAQVLIAAQETAKTVWTSLRPIGDADPVKIDDHDVIVYE